MAEKILSPRFSFEGWDWVKFFNSMEKPVLGLTTAVIALIQILKLDPLKSALIGVGSALVVVLFAALKFFLTEKKVEFVQINNK